jgi:hypothetical protein
MNPRFGAPSLFLCLAALPLLASAQPAPPDLSQLPPAATASAPEGAASSPLKRRCVAGCDGVSARISWSEDALNRFEEHRNPHGELVKLFVHPKSGTPKYEVLVGEGRNRESPSKLLAVNPDNSRPRDGQAVWRVKEF